MKSGSLRRILSYTYRYKWSFVISVVGFITFAAADIAAVEWIRRIISYIDSEEKNLNTTLLLEPNNEEALLMLMKIALEKSNYSKVKSLSEDFVKVCKNLCDQNKSILDSLANLEPKNES